MKSQIPMIYVSNRLKNCPKDPFGEYFDIGNYLGFVIWDFLSSII